MYVKTDRDNLQRLSLPEMEKAANFSDNNVAQVTAEDGELLINEYDHITEHKSKDVD
jgi:hypothetical protein